MKGTAINKKDFNEKVRPQDDFFEYSNGGWIKRTKIPAVESRWGTFYIVRDRNRKRVQGLIEENAKKRAKKVSDEQKMRDLYLLNLDTKRRNKEGVAPLQEYLTKINKIEYIETLLSAITELHRIGIDVPWAIYIDQDDKDSDKLVLRFHQSGLGMPSRDYYLKKDKESVRVKNAYKKHIVSVHRLLGQSPQEAGNNMNIIMEMESAIARVSMTNVELRDIPAQYNKKTIAELSRLVSAVDIKKYLKEMGIPVLRSVIVDQPEFMSGVNKLISTRPLNDWRVYLTWHLVNGYAGALSDKFVKENFNFYTTVILGVKKMRSQKERAAIAVGSGLGELVGKIYISKYFPNKAKQEVNKLIDNITIAYKKRIKNLDWMSDATKKKALNKLDTVVRKVGFPDTWKSHKSLLIDQKLSYAKNLMAIEKFYWKREVHKLGRPVDKKEWHMTPQTVNAYYSFATNSINFPAGILQPPFFDIDGDSAVNYGAMGAIIGHELSHGFDDMGSQFDGNGNRKNWWTKKDKQKFDKKGQTLVKQFNKYEVDKGLLVNGELTLGENIGDLGGLVMGYYALKEAIRKNEVTSENKLGFTPEQRFFFGASLFERGIYRKEYIHMQVRNDPHSPAKYRINGPFSNMDEFYEAFDVKKGDKLYRNKKDRVVIW